MLGTLYFGIIEGMKVLLYLEGKSVLQKSGIGRALQHQMHALDLAGIPYTTDILGDYDVVHINTYGPRSFLCSMQQSVVERKSSCMAIQPVRILKIPLSGLTFCALVWEVFGSHVPKGRLCDHAI